MSYLGSQLMHRKKYIAGWFYCSISWRYNSHSQKSLQLGISGTLFPACVDPQVKLTLDLQVSDGFDKPVYSSSGVTCVAALSQRW